MRPTSRPDIEVDLRLLRGRSIPSLATRDRFDSSFAQEPVPPGGCRSNVLADRSEQGLNLWIAELNGKNRQPSLAFDHVTPEPGQRGLHDRVVIERQGRGRSRLEPARLRGVVGPSDFGERRADDRGVSQADRPSSRVAPRCAENSDGSDRPLVVELRLLEQLAAHRGFDGLLHLQEASGDGPGPGERVVLAFDEQDFERGPNQGEDDEVDGHRRARVLVAVRSGHRDRVSSPFVVGVGLILRQTIIMNEQSAKLISWPETNHDEDLRRCVARLTEADGPADESGVWPETLWSLLTDARAPRWALPKSIGGDECGRTELLERYARVTEGSMTAAFILTQHDSGVRRLLAARDRPVAEAWISAIAGRGAFTTVGISQLTTSRRHGAQAMRAVARSGGGYRLEGTMPWVTAAERADVLVTGAVLEDGEQLLIALPTDRPGLTIPPPFNLAALQASRTTEVVCHAVDIRADEILAGPSPNVIATPGAAGTGGLETSALALGLARAALNALIAEIATPKRTR